MNFRVFIHSYSLRPQTYFRSSLTRVLNQFGNKLKSIDDDKVGSKKPLANPVSCRVNRLLISQSNLQASETELNAAVRVFLFGIVFFKG